MAALLLLALAGCGTRAEAPAEPGGQPPVYTDWSKLTPYRPAEQLYTYHPGYCGAGALEERSDYGALLPYIGAYAAMDRYVVEALPLYGLVTSEGALVTDPVYAEISFHDGFLVLCRAGPGGTVSCTLAAPDGRWVRQLAGSYYVGEGSGLFLTASADGGLQIWSAEGEAVTAFDGSLFTARLGEDFTWGEEGGPWIDWTDNRVGYVTSYQVNGESLEEAVRLYLDFASGAVTDTPPEGYPDEIDYDALYGSAGGSAPQPPDVPGCRYLDPITDQVTGETYFYGYYCPGEEEDGRYALFDGGGGLLVDNADLWRFDRLVIVRAGLCSTLEDGCFCFRSLAENEPVFRYAMGTNSD